MNHIQPIQQQFSFSAPIDKTNRLREQLKSELPGTQDIRDFLTLSKDEYLAKVAERDDVVLEDGFLKDSRRKGWRSAGLSVALLAATATGGIWGLMMAAPVGLIAGGLNFFDPISHSAKAAEDLGAKNEFTAECLADNQLLEVMRGDDKWLKSGTKSSQSETLSSEQTPGTQSSQSLFERALGVANAARMLPQIATAPIVHALLPPESAAQETRNERIGGFAGVALTGLALSALSAVPVVTFVAFALSAGSIWAGVTGGTLNSGRKTAAQTAGIADRGERILTRVKQGYKNSLQGAIENGEDGARAISKFFSGGVPEIEVKGRTGQGKVRD